MYMDGELAWVLTALGTEGTVRFRAIEVYVAFKIWDFTLHS